VTRAVVDVNVFVSALISPEGVAARLVQHTANRDFELVMSPRLVRELATVTRRSKFRQYFSIQEAERLITDLWDLGLRVDDAKAIPRVTRDPDDDYLVALLRTSQADALVSGDRDLLDLEVAEVEVLAPREFVERLDAGEISNQQ
jgi:putative PIN family toxin of toxin-antitoxin system